MLFNFKSSVNKIENSLNIDSKDGNWILKSNGNVNVLSSNGTIIEEIVLKDYMCVPITITGIPDYLCVFCLPSAEKNQYAYSLNNKTSITLGRDSTNNIVYQQNMMAQKHATIKYENDNWFIVPSEENKDIYVYINNQRVTSATPIFAGDIIFTNGLRIIWMKKSFVIPMSSDLYKINDLPQIALNNNIDNSKYRPTSEIDNNISLYNEDEYFSHKPRIRSIIEPEQIEIDAPPGRQFAESDMPFLLSIGSSFMMFGMMSLNAYNLFDNISSGKKDIEDLIPQILMIVFMLVGSILLPFLTKRWNKKIGRKREKLRQDKYTEYLKEKEKEILAKKKKQEEIVIENYLTSEECIQTIKKRNMLLWNRTIRDNDFLSVRLGIGNHPIYLQVNAPQEKFTLDDDNLFKQVCELGEKYKYLENVPITVGLKDQIVTSFIVQNNKDSEIMNNVLLQLLSLHSPLELKIVVLTDEFNSYKWDYLRYTNHNWSDDKQVRYFATNQDEAKALCQFLDLEFLNRKEMHDLKSKESADLNKDKLSESQLYDSYYLIISDSYKNISNFKFIQDLLQNQYNYGFSMLILDKDMKNIPNKCKKFVVFDDNECGMFNEQLSERNTIKFKAEYCPNIDMREISRIVGNIPVKGRDAESQLPTSLSFLQMYNVGKVQQLNVRNRWATSDPMNTLSTPIGVHVNGELFNLDLHEKYDGPHGLIAGSTGSGKSEFIITYILSMALNYDPREVQFVLIDYKGGGLAGAFENRELGISIPHLAGTITNLDTAEMNRTLVSIESELRRRQIKFNQVKEMLGESTMDIYKYQRLYREGVIDEPISHLFIISDEFAELKAQQPDFMSQLVSTARIGRSLGVHLILATQKPSGVVNDQIWSNSRFKVCLKVQTKADSMEMLKRPEAASIKETGRFYLQVGYDEYFDIGQSAWSGDKYLPAERIIKKKDDTIFFVGHLGNVIKRSLEKIKQGQQKEDYGDQLTNIVRYLDKVSKEDNLVVRKLWLPALRPVINIKDLAIKYNYKSDNNCLSIKSIIGEFDAPANQQQGILLLDLLNYGNTLIYGVPGSGKDNLLSTIMYYLSVTMSPEDINFYVADFGAETLKIFNKLPHVGDVFVLEEVQKLNNLIKMLNEELERRKKEYSDFGGSYTEYIRLSGKKDPFIVTMINNYENFLENFPRMADVFANLFRDGFKYGISFMLTTTQQNAVRSRVAQNFPTKICMKMPNTTDYRDLLGIPKGMIPADVFGRGIISIDNTYFYEFQTADICSRDVRVPFIKKVGEALDNKYEGKKAKKIPVLPDIAYIDDVKHELKGLDCIPIGIEKNSLEVYVYNFLEQKINLIAAKSIKNHIYFIYALIKQMTSLDNVKVHVIDAMNIYRGNYEDVDLYTTDLEKAFVNAYKNVQNDKNLEEKHVYFIIGISEFKKKVSDKYNKNFEALFAQVPNCKNNTFLYFDDSDDYKQIQVENWFRGHINNTFGIWLGEDIGLQVALGVMSLSMEDRNTVFPCIGFPIYQGKHMIIKYVVDGVDKTDEQ
jgi:S-DNA-T family DNA segregation ATPase FtsK/SpoIIIE